MMLANVGGTSVLALSLAQPCAVGAGDPSRAQPVQMPAGGGAGAAGWPVLEEVLLPWLPDVSVDRGRVETDAGNGAGRPPTADTPSSSAPVTGTSERVTVLDGPTL